jgi:hypothetical protein
LTNGTASFVSPETLESSSPSTSSTNLIAFSLDGNGSSKHKSSDTFSFDITATSDSSSIEEVSHEVRIEEIHDQEGFYNLSIPSLDGLPLFIGTDCGCKLQPKARSCEMHIHKWKDFLKNLTSPNKITRMRRLRNKHRKDRNSRLAELEGRRKTKDELARALLDLANGQPLQGGFILRLEMYLRESHDFRLEELFKHNDRSEDDEMREKAEIERQERYRTEKERYKQLKLRRKQLNATEEEEFQYLAVRNSQRKG